MSAVDQREFDALRREVQRLREGMAQRPIIVAGSAPPPAFRVVVITGGNTLSTGQLGCKYSSSPIASVASDYDPDVDTSFPDGLCRGDYYIDGVIQSHKVMLVLDTRSALNFALVASDIVYVATSVSMTGGSRPYYIPGFI